MAHLDQFPMFRFATLLARQLSSPIANTLKTYARDHPRFGRTVCARAGRWYRAAELRFKMWSLRLAGPRAPISVSDREAIDVGTDILGEVILFSIGALIIIFEVNRQAMKQEAQKLEKRSRWMAIRVALDELKIELEIQQKEIDSLLTAIRSLDPNVPLPVPSALSKPVPHPAPALEPVSPALSSPSAPTPTATPAPSSSSTSVTHPPGCTCVPPTPPLPPKPSCFSKTPPPTAYR